MQGRTGRRATRQALPGAAHVRQNRLDFRPGLTGGMRYGCRASIARHMRQELHVAWERRGRRCPVQGVGVVERLMLRNRMMPLDSDPNVAFGGSQSPIGAIAFPSIY